MPHPDNKEPDNKAPNEAPTRAWHALTETACLDAMDTDSRGVTESEARVRLAQHGPNEVQLREPPSALARFARQFNTPLLFVPNVVNTFCASRYCTHSGRLPSLWSFGFVGRQKGIQPYAT